MTTTLWTHQEAIARIMRAAKRAARGDKYAQWLVKEFRAHAVGSRLQSGGKIIAAENRRVKRPIVYMLCVYEHEKQWLGYEPGSNMSYRNKSLVFIYTSPWQEWYLGVVALHEMVHWDDLDHSKREPKPVIVLSDDYCMGEVRAHTTGFNAMNRIMNGGFDRIVQEILSNPDLHEQHEIGFVLPSKRGQEFTFSAFPDKPLGITEASSRAGAVQIAVVFAQCETPEDKAAAYRSLLSSQS